MRDSGSGLNVYGSLDLTVCSCGVLFDPGYRRSDGRLCFFNGLAGSLLALLVFGGSYSCTFKGPEWLIIYYQLRVAE